MSLRGIISFALFVICGVFSYIFIMPSVEEVMTLRRTFARNSEDVAKALGRFSATQEAIKQFQGLPKNSLDLVDAALPKGVEIADLYVITDDIIARSGLVGGGININSSGSGNLGGTRLAGGINETSSSNLGGMSISFNGSGDYETLKAFLSTIEGHLRIFDVESINISTTAKSELGDDVLNIGVQIKTYYDTSNID
jgi:hypothetical protein